MIPLMLDALLAVALAAPVHRLSSPDGLTHLTVEVGERVTWSVRRRETPVLLPSEIALALGDGRVLGRGAALRASARRTVDERLTVPVPARRRTVRDRYHELRLDLRDGLSLSFRAYDDGVAYRLRTALPGPLRIRHEEARFVFPEGAGLRAPLVECRTTPGVDCFHTSFEETYTTGPLASFDPGRMAILPVLVEVPDGPKVVITEADLEDYPGLWLSRAAEDGRALRSVFAGYPLEEKVMGDTFPQAIVTRRADHVAEVAGTREYPWRVLVVADRDETLPETDIVWRLGGELEVADPSWIRTGKNQSEWLYDNVLYGVDFTTGYNTETYRHYLRFAERFGLAFLFFDAGWSRVEDPFALTPTLDLPQLIREAKALGKGVNLWVSSLALGRDMERILDRLAEWGVSGYMVDFMDRDDQKMVRFYRRVAEESARRKLSVNFHGAFKPTGLERRFPNALTREGVVAFEWNKWSDKLTVDYEVTVPFIRGVAGPLDYEPGAMRNAQKQEFRAIGSMPMSQGTRVHQLAMHVVYESPWQKMGGNVSDYFREPEFTEWMARVPTVWEETRVLAGRVGEHVMVLRTAADGSFYVGAMAGREARELALDLSFLPAGPWRLAGYEDGPNAHQYGADHRRFDRTVTAADRLTLRLASGGGWAGRFARP
jgi:alpha-glucosidase